MPKAEIPTDKIIAALQASQGTIVAAARSINIDPITIYRRIKKSAEVRKVIAESREFRIDMAEMRLAQKVNEGEAWAVCFTLKCLGKDRGYVERSEVSGPDGGPIEVQVQLEQKAKQFQAKMQRLIADQGTVIDVQANGGTTNGADSRGAKA